MGRRSVTPSTPTIYLFEVEHPDYGRVMVQAVDSYGATVEAAKEWGVPEDWGSLAGECRVKRLGVANRPTCRRCHSVYGEPGQPSALCPECLAAAERWDREMRRFRPRRRKPGE